MVTDNNIPTEDLLNPIPERAQEDLRYDDLYSTRLMTSVLSTDQRTKRQRAALVHAVAKGLGLIKDKRNSSPDWLNEKILKAFDHYLPQDGDGMRDWDAVDEDVLHRLLELVWTYGLHSFNRDLRYVHDWMLHAAGILGEVA